jgi:hypothetical protein
MQFRLGGDLGRMLEEEAEVRRMTVPMLAKTILSDWFLETYKKRAKKPGKPQNQSLATTKSIPDSEPDADKSEGKTIITKVPEE